MKHKTITLHVSDSRYRVRLHSIDGRTWCAESPRRAADTQLRFNSRVRHEYNALRNMVLDNVTDEAEGVSVQ